tara:strand:- start:22 stop:396 length:375 start_codon:yes stop_codon:yes gene_type:complete
MTLTKSTPNVRFIYKICDSGLWEHAKKVGKFIGAEIDLQDGYIHFSTASQLRNTLTRHFSGREGLVLLTIEISQLDLIWETARSGDLFPHLYDNLPLHSVVAEHHLNLSADGDHIVPKACLCQS